MLPTALIETVCTADCGAKGNIPQAGTLALVKHNIESSKRMCAGCWFSLSADLQPRLDARNVDKDRLCVENDAPIVRS